MADDPPAEHRYAVVVAGGSGTRLWPLSRGNLPKQMQALMSDKTLIEETVDRLHGVVPASNIYVSTTVNFSGMIKKLLPDLPDDNIIVEPVARGTAAAFALFTQTLYDRDPEAVIFSLASDHAIAQVDRFQETLRDCYAFVEEHRSHIALVGVTPTRSDSGLGYIKVGRSSVPGAPHVRAAEKLVEKPSHDVARAYVASGDYLWNAAYYCFAASTLLEAYHAADPRLVDAAVNYRRTGSTEDYLAAPEKVHEIECIDSGRYPLAVIPGNFTWSDIGNWQALLRALSELAGSDMVRSDSRQHIDVNSTNCRAFPNDGRYIATVGLDNVVVISTDDVVYVLNMDQVDSFPELKDKMPRGVDE